MGKKPESRKIQMEKNVFRTNKTFFTLVMAAENSGLPSQK